MNAADLKEFKTRVRELFNLYNTLVTIWNGKIEPGWHGEIEPGCNARYPVTIVIKVILYNIAFDASNCIEYSHKDALKEVEQNLEALRQINNYEDRRHMSHYPYTELSLLYDYFSSVTKQSAEHTIDTIRNREGSIVIDKTN